MSSSTASAWGRVSKVRLINAAIEYCDPNADSCTLAQSWPLIQYSGLPATGYIYVTDPGGGQTRYTFQTGNSAETRLAAIRRPGLTNNSITYSYYLVGTSLYMLDTATSYGGTARDYTWYGSYAPLTITGSSYSDALGRSYSATVDYATGRITSETDAFGGVTIYARDSLKRVTDVTYPEGNRDHYDYDARGNVLAKTSYPKPGAGLANIVVQASYPGSCANPKTCNRPTSAIDANGNQTDFTYDPAHGGILTKTGPADSGGVRPQTRYEYAQYYAWMKNASGTYAQASNPVWKLARERYCRTTAASGSSCSGGSADEVVIDYIYDSGNASKGSNLVLKGVAVTADGQTHRTCYGYDIWARKISETKPNANLSSCP